MKAVSVERPDWYEVLLADAERAYRRHSLTTQNCLLEPADLCHEAIACLTQTAGSAGEELSREMRKEYWRALNRIAGRYRRKWRSPWLLSWRS